MFAVNNIIRSHDQGTSTVTEPEGPTSRVRNEYIFETSDPH
jgi:hypothetical protein